MEEKISFLSGDYELEGLFAKVSGDKGVVITHPHPLYGGDMYNPVVNTIASAYQKNGFATLRFNFRGVGKSQGNYDDGTGEQKDVNSAILYLSEMGIKKIDLAGYSFGAWVNAGLTCEVNPVKNMVMVSPPVGFIDFQPITSINCLKLVIAGNRDNIAPADLIEKMLPTWNQEAHFEVIKGADHFYSGYLEKLESVLSINL
jgi:alpha/beta superfamily hydrolase